MGSFNHSITNYKRVRGRILKQFCGEAQLRAATGYCFLPVARASTARTMNRSGAAPMYVNG